MNTPNIKKTRKHRGNRRRTTYNKAKRKLNIIREHNDYWNYVHFGTLRKGKIHCSCPMCAAKTNTKRFKAKGPNRCPYSLHWGSGSERYGKNYSISDRRKIDMLRYYDEEE